MANESLSQNEIDLLFSGGAPTEAPAPAPERLQETQVYDFRRPARISKDRKRSLMAMYGLLAKSLESWLSGRVRDHFEIDLQSVEQLTFGEFMLALPSPCASYVLDMNAGGHQGVIDFGHEFAYFIVDRLLGGSGRHVVPPRPLSQIERLVVRIFADRVAFQLSDVWKDHVALEMSVHGFESIPEMLQIANREDPVLVANLGVTIGDMSSLLLLCLPFASLEKFFTGTTTRRHQQAQGTEEERRSDRERLEAMLTDARVTIGARLPTFAVPVEELCALQEGAILQTGLSPQSPLDLLVAGQRRFVGAPGRVGRNLAVRVQEGAAPDPPDLIEAAREAEALGLL